ncbi:MAG: ATP-binding cassette domain-containing protein [Planctomycetota bacterium]
MSKVAVEPDAPTQAPADHPPATPRAAPDANEACSVEVSDACVTFANGVEALRSISLEVRCGEHVAIVGPSGSGKTTLLDCLAGEVTLTAGELRRQGHAARVYQDYRLVERTSALRNVMHGAAGRDLGWWRRIQRRRQLAGEAVELLGVMGLSERASTRTGRLSGGERQRVAIARALMAQPAIVLADEPVSALDAGSARAVMAMLDSACRQQRVTLVSVLHDCELAEAYADRIVGMRDGRIAPAPPSIVAPTQSRGALAVLSPSRDGLCAVCPDDQPAAVAQASAANAKDSVWRMLAWTAGTLLVLATIGWSVWATGWTDVRWSRLWPNLQAFTRRLVPTQEQFAGMPWRRLGVSFLQTLAMTLLGTVAAITWSLPLAAIAAKNVGPAWIRVPTRLALNVLRSVPSILLALLAVGLLGLGPAPGVVALAAYSTGYLTKFFYEAFESVDDKSPAALRSLGMSGPEAFLAATWPASRLAIASSCVFMLEYNFRAASVLGVVGAGGLGYDLKLAVEWANWHVVGVILAVLAASVIVFDQLADRLRRALR